MIAIGDIHGCIDELNRLLERLPRHRQLIFLGDYIDRGPDSKAVIDRLIRLRIERECVFLRGNHDQMMLDSYYGDYEAADIWFGNGAFQTIASYGGTGLSASALQKYVPSAHMDFLCNTILYHDTDDFFFVHGGISPHLTVEQAVLEHSSEEFLWYREHLRTHIEPVWEKTVVCGHTIVDQPIIKDKLIAIDTGAFLPYIRRGEGELTAILLPERELVQVESKINEEPAQT